MKRFLTTAVALSALLGTTGLALAQSAQPGPYYYGSAPAYGQPVTPPTAAMSQHYPQQSWPATDGTHTTGTGGRAYNGGQKTN